MTSITQSHPHTETSAPDLERAARTALEALSSRSFTDDEWRQLRSRLLEFATILRQWGRKPATNQHPADHVVVMPSAASTRPELQEAA
jgi:hypothetical protein